MNQPTTIAQWNNAHGDEVEIGSMCYSADGSARLVDFQGKIGTYGPQPPDDPTTLASNLLEYAKAKLQKAVRRFDQMKRELLADTDAPAHPQRLVDLKDAQVYVGACRSALESAQAEYDRTRPGWLSPEERAAADEFDAQRESALVDLRRTVAGIEV